MLNWVVANEDCGVGVAVLLLVVYVFWFRYDLEVEGVIWAFSGDSLKEVRVRSDRLN